MTERVDVGSIRRAQIVEAARRVIARKGIQGASLSEIEQEAGVSRGVLTYHFRSKEDIILAVFDDTVTQMKQEAGAGRIGDRAGWERFEAALDFVLTKKPQDDPLDCLQYTFLAQMSHRDDFRARLAAEYAAMRKDLAADFAERATAAGHDADDLRAITAVALGAIHGLIMQLNVDPKSYDPTRVMRVFKDMLLGYLARSGPGEPPAVGRKREGKRSSARK
jgi:AcrR family transcriptional regulator